MPDNDPLRARIARAEEEVSRLAKGPYRPGGRSFRMTVPVDDGDSDMVLLAGLAAGREALEANATLREAIVAIVAEHRSDGEGCYARFGGDSLLQDVVAVLAR